MCVGLVLFDFGSFVSFVCLLVAWLVGWLDGWLAGWLACLLVCVLWLVACLCALVALFGWSTKWLTC